MNSKKDSDDKQKKKSPFSLSIDIINVDLEKYVLALHVNKYKSFSELQWCVQKMLIQ